MVAELHKMQQRNDTSASWTANNPILLVGEHGYDTDAQAEKIGDGTTAWNDLPYSNQSVVGDQNVVGNQAVGGNQTVGGDQDVSGTENVGADLNVGNNANVGEDLGVGGAAAVAGNCAIVGNLHVGTLLAPGVIIAGAIYLPVVPITSEYNVSPIDSTLIIDTMDNNVPLTLDDAASGIGETHTFKRISGGANTCVINTILGETIDGESTASISAQWGVLRIISDGSNWFTI